MSRLEQKSQTRQRIGEAAGRSFRKGGFGGVGVDGLAKEAGVTSGAFYGHFGSKSDAFHEAVAHGMADLKAGVLYYQQTHGSLWWPEFVKFYLGTKRLCDLAESCGLQALSPEVARASPEAFEGGLKEVSATILSGPKSPKAPRDAAGACSALSALVGAVTLARAVGSEQFADAIAASAGAALLGELWQPR